MGKVRKYVFHNKSLYTFIFYKKPVYKKLSTLRSLIFANTNFQFIKKIIDLAFDSNSAIIKIFYHNNR